MSGSFRDFLKHLKESGKSESLKGGDFLRKAAALWKGKEYVAAKRCKENADCDIGERCGVRGGCVQDRGYKPPKRSSPKRSSPKRSSPKRSSPKRSSPKRSSPIKASMKKYELIRKRDRLVEALRTEQSLFNLMNGDGFVDINSVNTHGLNKSQLECNELEIVDVGGKTYIRATYGWKGPIAYRVLYGKYIPYIGSNNVFCVSHTTLQGLGELNFGRRINVLDTPDRCPNKGVRGFIDINESRAKGLTFFSKIGDRYGNRIFSFDPELNRHFFKIEYISGYDDIENLKRMHKDTLELYKKFMSEENALAMLKKLVIIDSA